MLRWEVFRALAACSAAENRLAPSGFVQLPDPNDPASVACRCADCNRRFWGSVGLATVGGVRRRAAWARGAVWRALGATIGRSGDPPGQLGGQRRSELPAYRRARRLAAATYAVHANSPYVRDLPDTRAIDRWCDASIYLGAAALGSAAPTNCTRLTKRGALELCTGVDAATVVAQSS